MSGELVVRPAGDGDVALTAALLNRATRAMYGTEDTTEEEMRTWFESPSVQPARDIRVAERAGEPAGYADVYDENGTHTRYWFDVRLDPERGDEEVAVALVDWLEARTGGERLEGAFLRGFVQEHNEVVKRVLEARGFELVRHSYRMAIELPDELDEPVWPDGVSVRPMVPGEERQVYEVHEECFADHWEHEREPFEEWAHWTIERESFDPTLWFVAVDSEGELAGYALCREHDAEPDLGWVAMLGVRPPWRRRGLGKALLLHVFAEFASRGYPRVGLGVDGESLTGANRLYESAGMEVIRRFDVYEKTLA